MDIMVDIKKQVWSLKTKQNSSRIHESPVSVPASGIYASSLGTGWWQLPRVPSPLGTMGAAALPSWWGKDRAQPTFSE